MKRSPLALAFVASLLAASAAGAQQKQLPVDSMALARKYMLWLYTGQADSLWAHSTPETQQGLKTKEAFTQMTADLAERGGTEEQVLEEKFITRNGKRQYWRTAKFSSFTAEPLIVRLVIEPSGLMSGFGMGPKSQAPPIDPKSD